MSVGTTLIDTYFKGDFDDYKKHQQELSEQYNNAHSDYYAALGAMDSISKAQSKLDFLKGKIVYYDAFFGRIKSAHVYHGSEFMCYLEYTYYIGKDDRHLYRYQNEMKDDKSPQCILCGFYPNHELRFLDEDEFVDLKKKFCDLVNEWGLDKYLPKELNKYRQDMKPVPEEGKRYHFFDDGKCSVNRLYVATVVRVWDYKDIKDLVFEIPNFDNMSTELFTPNKFVDIYENAKSHNSLYARETDMVIELSIPKYDDEHLFAVRTSNGGWFTMNIDSGWQSGRLDVDDTIFQDLKKCYEDENDCNDINWDEYTL